ncbi:MAG: hypothetical protein EOP22_00685 [Hyphomicrobiales bacterium]|nr:MAG: hypothetical protein EOP22_00685 [Hyphomicrobiales bacterium]
MRIAVTGTHGSGKTTLIDDFVDRHRHYERELEPYWALAQNGVPFADGVSVPDLEEQLEASIGMILARATDGDVIFDRCPLDFIAYLEVVAEGQGFDWSPTGRQLGRIEQALAALDLLVFLPLHRPDEIAATIEFPKLRARVDARLKSMLRDDSTGLLEAGPRVLELRGSPSARVAALSAAIG